MDQSQGRDGELRAPSLGCGTASDPNRYKALMRRFPQARLVLACRLPCCHPRSSLFDRWCRTRRASASAPTMGWPLTVAILRPQTARRAYCRRSSGRARALADSRIGPSGNASGMAVSPAPIPPAYRPAIPPARAHGPSLLPIQPSPRRRARRSHIAARTTSKRTSGAGSVGGLPSPPRALQARRSSFAEPSTAPLRCRSSGVMPTRHRRASISAMARWCARGKRASRTLRCTAA